MKKRDYSLRIWLLLAAVAATITAAKGFGLVSVGSMFDSAYEERFNAWYSDADADVEVAAEEAIVEYTPDFTNLEGQIAETEALVDEQDEQPIHEWVVTKCPKPKAKRIDEKRLSVDSSREIVPIEVFDGDTTSHNFSRFLDKLIWGQEVRIAFMGDSFIEGDILTSDLREALQTTFGGRGVGFVQCDIPFATSRKTIKRTVSGWDAYSVLKPKKNPASINDAFFVSGYTARGGQGAKASWKTTTAFEHLDSCSRARILLTTPDSVATVRVMINRDTTLKRDFDIVNVGLPQEIRFEGSVESVDLEVLTGRVDCYGASIEGCGGVIVDNLSMRANSGHAIFGTNAGVNKQIDTYVGYDLVVLQYGLNVMEAGRSNYSAYRNKLKDMITYAKSCFPDAAILVLGVSDRWVKDAESGVYGPMSSVGSMKSYQREAAEQSAVSFWPTSDAMTLYGGMPGFVSNGWAAKDYTHINFAGGKRVGEELHRSIVKSAYDRLKSGNSQAPTATAKPRVQPIKVETKPAEINNGVTFVAPAETKPAVTETQDAATTNEGGSTEQGASDIIVEQQTENLIVSDSMAMQQPVVELQEEIMVEREQPAEVEGDIEAEVEAVVETEAQKEVVVEDAPQEVPVSESEDDSAVAEDDEFFREVL